MARIVVLAGMTLILSVASSPFEAQAQNPSWGSIKHLYGGDPSPPAYDGHTALRAMERLAGVRFANHVILESGADLLIAAEREEQQVFGFVRSGRLVLVWETNGTTATELQYGWETPLDPVTQTLKQARAAMCAGIAAQVSSNCIKAAIALPPPSNFLAAFGCMLAGASAYYVCMNFESILENITDVMDDFGMNATWSTSQQCPGWICRN